MRVVFGLVGWVLLAVLLAGCQETIDLDLRTSERVVGVEAVLTDTPGEGAWVQLYYTTNYFTPEQAEPVIGAVVIISEQGGWRDTLPPSDSVAGRYENPLLVGEPGKTYELEILVGGQRITAREPMPAKLPLDSISLAWRKQNNLQFEKDGYYITVYRQDPPGKGDAVIYRFYRNDTLLTNFNYQVAFDDNLVDGQYIAFELFMVDFPPGGYNLTVEMATVSPLVFQFYDLQELLAQGELTGPFSPPPWNPPSNLEGPAVGIFRVSPIVQLRAFIPESAPD